MSDEEALLAAIAANPDEDTPRLAYADWLDENDRPIRAEFIRLQIEIARVETLPRILLNRYVDLFKRQQEVIDNHREELLGPLSGLPDGVIRVEFRRGFVSELKMSPAQFVRDADRIASTQPLPRVVIEGTVDAVCRLVGFDDADRLPSSHRDLISAVRTVPGRTGDEPWAGPELPFRGSTWTWPRLDELDLSGCRLGAVSFGLLIQGGGFLALSDLDVSANDLLDLAIAALLNSQLPRQLQRLILGGNPISDLGATMLAHQWPRGVNDRLAHLNLRFTNIGRPGQQELLKRFGGRIDLF